MNLIKIKSPLIPFYVSNQSNFTAITMCNLLALALNSYVTLKMKMITAESEGDLN